MRGRENKLEEAKSQGGTRTTRRRKNGLESPDGRMYITDLSTTDIKNKIISQDTSVLKVNKPMSPNPSESSALLNNYIKSSCTTPDNSSVENNCSSKDIVHMLTSLDPDQLREENLHLRELLISQLDLIQQQSETILSKDKQLKDLRMENENLHQRLERMQRRPARRDTDSPTRPRDKVAKDPRKRAVGDMAPEEQRGVVQNKRIKQEVDEYVEPKELQQSQEELDSTIRVDMPEYAVIDELRDEIYDDGDDLFRKEEKKAIPSLPDSNIVTPASEDVEDSEVAILPEKKVQKPKRERPKSRKNRKCSSAIMPYGGQADQALQTPYHYYIGCRNDIVNVDDKLNEVAVLQRGVEVPKFREDTAYDKKMSKIQSSNKNPYGGKSKENLELMDDAVYIKRHEKPEALEKRTKKRDIQRQRERIYCEKMRLREKNRTSHSSKKVQLNSLLPTPEGAQYIQIIENDKVPVTAFGEPVLALNQTHFSLPWLEEKTVPKKRRHHSVV